MSQKETIMSLVRDFNKLIQEASDIKKQIRDELDILEIDPYDFEDVSIAAQANNTCNFAENFSYSEKDVEAFLDEKIEAYGRE